MSEYRVVESPSGVRHAYTTYLGVGRAACGQRVPQHRGWFGPIDKPVDCSRCLRTLAGASA